MVRHAPHKWASEVDPRAFVDAWSKAGPAHHCAIGVGHHAGWLAKLADILEIRFSRVC